MIESISIAGFATYGMTPEVLNDLSQFNFVFGSNGSGKTTISRIIADEDAYPSCLVAWKAGTKLQALVYNSDFVERNFNQSPELKGVFTLGENHADTLRKIETAKKELDELTQKIESLTNSLNGADGEGGKKGELASLEEEFKTRCWRYKQEHDERLSGAFERYRGSAEKFKDKILKESESNSVATLPLEELEKKAETIFGPTPSTESLVSTVDMSGLLANESNTILQKRVIGKRMLISPL
jgi:wobble nucleotide-excising tRNase